MCPVNAEIRNLEKENWHQAYIRLISVRKDFPDTRIQEDLSLIIICTGYVHGVFSYSD